MIFLTGFPGFLGTRFVRALAEQHPESSFLLLIQPKFDAQARGVLQDLGLTDRAELVHGDITEPDLGLGTRHDELAEQVTRAFHLAAVYDLSIPREIGWKVNVDGTRHVVDFLEQAPDLEVFGYISTAYVSGKRTGVVREDELVHDTGFKNFYEETKYHAEVIVQGRMDAVPTIIFRPAVVVGDSETGETAKFDGPYFILKALQKLPPVTLMTRIGSGTREVNLVPVDYVIDAMTYLQNQEENIGKTFHLTDPNPLTTQGVMETFTELLDMKVAYVPIPPAVARALMSTGVGRFLGISPELIDYFDHPVHYDTSDVENALKGSGIRCPRLPEYAPNMVDFMQKHAELRSDAMY
ncbi:3-beta hydroxysteroid dehydrogenase [Longibacter salinarum]|uniref:3-beta hydroxysteroid dehydrogenase n=1 Tax=Longibacter salinarum TaxID=1850348 RepID=A0A2A8CUX8_9BACT|nr:SDR family oxidoreductase [Longibacter salinarum]PEN12267.1 3-beta hydroxysteroid dehydrogenase [Longibacter salinarum]